MNSRYITCLVEEKNGIRDRNQGNKMRKKVIFSSCIKNKIRVNER